MVSLDTVSTANIFWRSYIWHHQYCQNILPPAHMIPVKYSSLPSLSPEMKILWRSSRLLHSFKAFTSPFKERNILVSWRFPSVFCLRLTPLRVPVLMISSCLGNLHSLPFLHWYGSTETVSLKVPQIPWTRFFLARPVHVMCRFKYYTSTCRTSDINSAVFALILYDNFYQITNLSYSMDIRYRCSYGVMEGRTKKQFIINGDNGSKKGKGATKKGIELKRST